MVDAATFRAAETVPAIPQLLTALTQLIPVAVEFQERRIDRNRFAQIIGHDTAVVDALVEHGFPHEICDRSQTFEYCDAVNLALHARLGCSIPETAESVMLRYAGAPSATWVGPARWRVGWKITAARGSELEIRMPDASVWGGANLSLEVDGVPGPPGGAVRAAGGTDVLVAAEVRTQGQAMTVRSPLVRGWYDRVLADLAEGALVYQWMPARLQRDPEAFLSRGTLDCVATSLLIARWAAAAGVEARTRRGVVLGLMGVEHTWTEVRDIDGHFKPLDPIFAHLVSRKGADAGEFTEFCAGSVPNRFLPFRIAAAEPIVKSSDESMTVAVSATRVSEDR
ncbi:hypothetical protein [Nocardia tengchongensis]|uniref:hypothetical protein n=1 Tax=Nocardia tengchongensis TaxID=2055889 RepID=UPI0036C1BF9A